MGALRAVSVWHWRSTTPVGGVTRGTRGRRRRVARRRRRREDLRCSRCRYRRLGFKNRATPALSTGASLVCVASSPARMLHPPLKQHLSAPKARSVRSDSGFCVF
jgi:hypothetical protein